MPTSRATGPKNNARRGMHIRTQTYTHLWSHAGRRVPSQRHNVSDPRLPGPLHVPVQPPPRVTTTALLHAVARHYSPTCLQCNANLLLGHVGARQVHIPHKPVPVLPPRRPSQKHTYN